MSNEPSHKRVTSVDRCEVADVLARYCFFVDEGKVDEWVSLWTDDGVFAGVTPDPIRGREALKQVPRWSLSGGSRHKLVNLFMDYGETPNEIVAQCYNFITNWLNGGAIGAVAVAKYSLIRREDTWKIKSNQVRMLVPPHFDPQRLPEGFPYPANEPTHYPSID